MGPPPIPKKADKRPSTRPMHTQTTGWVTFLAVMRGRFRVYARTPRVRAIIMTCCATETVMPPAARTSSKSSLPATPPMAAPMASSVPLRGSTFTSPPRLRIIDVMVMAKTVQPDRKLTVATGMPETASSTGLMMTPPPTPLMPPMVVAKRQIRKLKRICILSSHSSQRSWAKRLSYAPSRGRQ